MNHSQKFSILFFLAVIAPLGLKLQAQTVAWGTSANIDPISFTSTGATDNLTWQLGWFNDGFAPDATNAQNWGANWNAVATSQYTDFGGFYAVSVNTSDVGAAAAGRQMYIFAYNDLNRMDTPQGEALIFRQDGQFFPGQPNFETFDVEDSPFDPSDDNFTVIWGQVDRNPDAAGGVLQGDGVASDLQLDSVTLRPFATFETQSFTWLIRDEEIFVATPDILQGSPFGHLPTLEQRVGDRIWLHSMQAAPMAGGRRPVQVPAGEEAALGSTTDRVVEDLIANPLLDGGWVRVIYDEVDGDIGSGRTYDSRFMGMQVGWDFPLKRRQNGVWVLGLTGQLGELDADARSSNGYGSMETSGIGFGATATWYGNDGVYLDLQGQYNFLESDYSTRGDRDFADKLDMDLLSLSIELGKRFDLKEERFGLTPQVQLQWSHLSDESFTDSRGNNPVVMDEEDRLLGRLGLAVDYRIGDGSTESMRKIYGIANILHRFSDDADTFFSGETFTADSERTWGEIGLGGSIAWYNQPEDRIWQLYGEVAYRRAASSSNAYGTHLTIGARAAW